MWSASLGSFSSWSPCSSLAGLWAEDPPDLGVAPSSGPSLGRCPRARSSCSLAARVTPATKAVVYSVKFMAPGPVEEPQIGRGRLLGPLLFLAYLLLPLGGAPPGAPLSLGLPAHPSWVGVTGSASWGPCSTWPP